MPGFGVPRDAWAVMPRDFSMPVSVCMTAIKGGHSQGAPAGCSRWINTSFEYFPVAILMAMPILLSCLGEALMDQLGSYAPNVVVVVDMVSTVFLQAMLAILSPKAVLMILAAHDILVPVALGVPSSVLWFVGGTLVS